MRACWIGGWLLGIVAGMGITGCSTGKPRSETIRPDQQHNFSVLYQQNCSACHGDRGRNGAAIPLNNPVLLAWMGSNDIHQAITFGVPNSSMPAFGISGGGLLTAQQVDDIVGGMMKDWAQPGILNGAAMPAYKAAGLGDPQQGKAAFEVYCARCHGPDGKGTVPGDTADARMAAAQKGMVVGSIVDPTYLSLITPQGLRDILVAGMPGENMPDWRGDGQGRPMTDGEVTDIVAWMESHRVQFPGKPFPSSPLQ